MIPDAQKIVSDYLREHADVAALTDRVVAHPPAGDKRDTSWVQVQQLSAPQESNSPVDHLVEFYFQFDCYAGADGGFPEASELGRTVRAAIVDIANASIEDAVVTASRVTNTRPLPDFDIEPARDRFLVMANVWMHA